IGWNLAVLLQRFLQGDRNDLLPSQCCQAAEFAAMDHIYCAYAVAGSQHAVKCSRSAPALDVAQHDGAGLEAGALLDLLRQQVADAAQANVSELVFGCAEINGSVGNFG